MCGFESYYFRQIRETMNLPIYIDIDGTLTDSPDTRWGRVVPGRIEAVKRLIASGERVVLWSAGSDEYAKEFAKNQSDFEAPLPIILAGGTSMPKGFRNKEIAQRLNISEPTVKTHLYRIFRKLNMKNRSELITFAIKRFFATEKGAYLKDRAVLSLPVLTPSETAATETYT